MRWLDESIRRLVRAALEEDVGRGDVTSLACLEPEVITAAIVAKSGGVLSGLKPATATFAAVDPAINVRPVLRDGERFGSGDSILELQGFNQPILTAERTALNFLAHLSGIATLTSRFVEKISGTRCHILDTRKTTPGWRVLEKMAVAHGGGANHRMGLYDMILIKDNHIAAAGSVRKAVQRTREYLGSDQYTAQFGTDRVQIEFEVEVTGLEQLREAIAAGARRLLLDNQSLASLRDLVAAARSSDPKVRLEASGNVSLDNVAEIAATGVDFISIGAITHSAPAADFSLQVLK